MDVANSTAAVDIVGRAVSIHLNIRLSHIAKFILTILVS